MELLTTFNTADATFIDFIQFAFERLWFVLKLIGAILAIPLLLASGTLLGALKNGGNTK